MSKSLWLVCCLFVSLAAQAQQTTLKADESTGQVAATWQNPGTVNGFVMTPFTIKYRIFAYGGLRFGFAASSSWEIFSDFIYKGERFSKTEIPELNQIRIAGIKVRMRMVGPQYGKTITIDIDMGATASAGVHGNNNIELEPKTPEGDIAGFRPTIPEVLSVSYANYEAAFSAMGAKIAKKKKLEELAGLMSSVNAKLNAGQFEEAESDLVKAKAIAPEDPGVKQALEKYRQLKEAKQQKEKQALAKQEAEGKKPSPDGQPETAANAKSSSGAATTGSTSQSGASSTSTVSKPSVSPEHQAYLDNLRRQQELARQEQLRQQKIEEEKQERARSMLGQHLQNTQELEDRKREAAEATSLDMNHRDIALMEEEFERKMADLSRVQGELEQARQREWESRVKSTYWSGQNGDQFGDLVNDAGKFINSLGEGNRKKKAQEDLLAKRRRFLAIVENEKAAMRQTMREEMLQKSFPAVFFDAMPATGPRSIFGFLIIYNKSDLALQQSVVTISNIIEFGSYADGSWPSQLHLLQKEAQIREHGYQWYFTSKNFASRAAARQMRDAFIQLFSKNGQVKEVQLNLDVNAGGQRMDFWENKVAKN